MCASLIAQNFHGEAELSKACCQMWSNYKQHNTVKLQYHSFQKPRVNVYKYITKHCSILDKLLPGDLVLAERNFMIQDSVGFYCAEVMTPPFTKKQLS